MFWQVISGIAAAAAGRYRMTRSRFLSLTLLITGIWVLFGIWASKRPATCGETRHILTAGRVSIPAMHPRIRHDQRQPVRER